MNRIRHVRLTKLALEGRIGRPPRFNSACYPLSRARRAGDRYWPAASRSAIAGVGSVCGGDREVDASVLVNDMAEGVAAVGENVHIPSSLLLLLCLLLFSTYYTTSYMVAYILSIVKRYGHFFKPKNKVVF